MEDRLKIVKFLEEMSAQNNRATAFPYYYVIQDIEYVLASSDQYDKTEYRSKYDCSDCIAVEEYEALPEQDEDNRAKDDYEEIYLNKIFVDKNMFLTESDAEEHLKCNSYHYSSKARTYVKHCFRATQLEEFLTALFNHFEVPLPPERYYQNKDLVDGGE